MKWAIFAFLFLGSVTGLQADEIIVDTTADSGAGSLRAALTAAVENDIITIDESLSGTITLASSLPSINVAIEINGPSSGAVTIDGDSQYQIFSVHADYVMLTGLTLTNAHNGSGDGGAIFADECMVFVRDVFLDQASSMTSGAVFVSDNAVLFSTNITASSMSSTAPDIIISEAGALILNSDNSVTPQIRVSGNGHFFKRDVGTVTLVGTLSDALNVSIDEGTVIFEGDNSHLIVVNPGAKFESSATVNNLTNSGEVKTGGSIATLTVSDIYYQTNEGNLFIQVDPSGASDVIDIETEAFLQGTLTIVPAAGSYTVGTTYNFLTSAGQLNGTFDSVSFPTPPPNFQINYFTNMVQIEVIAP